MTLLATPDYPHLISLCSQIRRDIVRMVHNAQSGHPGGSLGCVEFFVALYFTALRVNSKFTIEGKDEDFFFLSNGHICPVWYATLARAGYFNIEELKTFRKLNSRLQGHPSPHDSLPGIRIASGSLGQGLSVAIGTCQAKKLNNENHLTYVLMGDGELQEGQIWEAAMYAAHHKVDNLIAIVDHNGQQIDGAVSHIMSLHDIRAKWQSFGWTTLVGSGNDLPEVVNTLAQSRHQTQQGKPVIYIMNTTMGHGVDFMMGSHKWHGIAPNDEELEQALSQLEETLGDY